MAIDMTITLGHVIQIIGYLVVAIGLYYGIRIDLTRMHEQRQAAMDKAVAAHELAGEAHDKLYRHVETFHTDRRKGS